MGQEAEYNEAKEIRHLRFKFFITGLSIMLNAFGACAFGYSVELQSG
jgi:hypothetical protein